MSRPHAGRLRVALHSRHSPRLHHLEIRKLALMAPAGQDGCGEFNGFRSGTSSPFHHYIYILYNTEITLFPAEDDGGGIPFRAAWVDTRVECCHRSNAAVSQTGPRHLREGAFDQIAPRARFGGMHLLKASRPGGQISHGFLRKVGRMMIQHPAHDGVRRSVTIQDLQ